MPTVYRHKSKTKMDFLHGIWASSSKQVTNSKWVLMDVMRIVHIADTPSWSLVTHILSTTPAAERRVTRRERGRKRQKYCTRQKAYGKRGQLLTAWNDSPTFQSRSRLCAKLSICCRLSPVKCKLWHVMTVSAETSSLSPFSYWSK